MQPPIEQPACDTSQSGAASNKARPYSAELSVGSLLQVDCFSGARCRPKGDRPAAPASPRAPAPARGSPARRRRRPAAAHSPLAAPRLAAAAGRGPAGSRRWAARRSALGQRPPGLRASGTAAVPDCAGAVPSHRLAQLANPAVGEHVLKNSPHGDTIECKAGDAALSGALIDDSV